MKLEVLYQVKYDYTVVSYGASSIRTETVRTGSVVWAGEDSPVPLIEQKERDFLSVQHPESTPHSYGHCNHRIEITGLRIGGEAGLTFKPTSNLLLPAAGVPVPA